MSVGGRQVEKHTSEELVFESHYWPAVERPFMAMLRVLTDPTKRVGNRPIGYHRLGAHHGAPIATHPHLYGMVPVGSHVEGLPERWQGENLNSSAQAVQVIKTLINQFPGQFVRAKARDH